MDFDSLLELGQIIDNAIDNKNYNELNNKIDFLKSFTDTVSDSIEKTYSCYLLGNAWNGIREIEHENNTNKIFSFEQEEVFKEIYYFRKVIQQKDFKNLDLSFQLAVYVNLGNAFSHYGRTILAIKYFDKAINLKIWHKNVIKHPNYFMALINKGLALEYYSKLDYDIGHKEYFIKFAYENFKQSIPIIDKYLENTVLDNEYYKKLKNEISLKLNWYEENFPIKELENISHFINYKTNFSKNEDSYRKWCLNNKLFLNSLNDLGNYNISTHDPLNLPNLITEINKGFPKFITNFNQIKQEYITYRHLLFEGINKKTPKFYDKDISITDDFDYNLYDINIEKVKLSFRGFYSVFDKIANFLNEYFNIGMKSDKVDFRKIWLDKNGIINPIFNEFNNLPLRGLYLISKDLFYTKNDDFSEEFTKSIEPEAQKINDIRNHLEHKFISIKLLDIEEFEVNQERDRNFSITQDELEEKTTHLSQLVREAMIYLSFIVHIEENKKNIQKNKCVDILLDLKI
jgi:hypothetical protein